MAQASATITGSTLTINLAELVDSSQALTVDTSAGNVEDSLANTMGLFEGLTVTNNSTVTPWPQVNGMIRDRLQQTFEVVSDDMLDPIVSAYANWLVSQYPCITSYSALTGGDKTAFDFGLALMVAAHARPYLPKASSIGDLTNYTHGTTRFAYSRVTGTAQKSTDIIGRTVKTVEQQWLDEAWLFLQQVSCIAAQVTHLKANFHLYALSGRRRRQELAGYVNQSMNPLYSLRIDELFAWYDLWRTP